MLATERQVVLDAYFGGRKLGEVRATISPGSIRFDDPAAIAGLIPNLARPEQLEASLGGTLPSHVAMACGQARREGCGILEPALSGVILDEERFRVDLFVHPDLLAKPDPAAAAFLPPPEGEPALVSQFGATLSGSNRSPESWHLQNRTIASLGSVRLRSDSSLSTGSRLTFDNLSLEADRKDWRYAGGIFWAPGTDLIGRRKIAGLGAATQLDTLQNKDLLEGTPLPIFLQQPARVNVLVDGRVVSSRIYAAGNRLIDTASLPNGSYDLTLNIQEDGRPVRQEQRFFTKGSAMAPLGRPLFSAFAGLLAPSNQGLSLDGDSFFYELTAAYRIAPQLGLDAAILGTQHKAIVEVGANYHSRLAQVRIAALGSSASDYGALVRVATTGKGPVSLSFDLRKVVSKDGDPLIPVSTSDGTFSEDPQSGFADRGSYSQILSILGYRIGQANFRLTGIYRQNGSRDSDYSIGASVEVPVVRHGRWDIVVQGDARKSDRDVASFVGVRILTNRGDFSFSGTGGIRHQSDRSARFVGETQASWYRQLEDQSQLSATAAVGRDVDGSYARASGYARSGALNARADLLHQFADRQTTHYTATIDSGIVLAGAAVGLAGRDMNDTAIMASVDGGDPAQKFELLIDDVRRGTIAGGRQLLLFLPPYRSYEVRIRPTGGQVAAFDTAPKTVTLYPGNVSRVGWTVTPLFILFGRAVGPDGKPLAHADVSGSNGIGRTDADGYFQIETRSGDRLEMTGEDGNSCSVAIGAARATDGLVSAGDLLCR
ncbi:MAG TPA: CS1-pili formation C-terminal domain-containing protein [Sphingomicrobium sp.]|nr:CS1-pili formation C-terminal domain-containing protein [Sphingomicrobium sp.]